MPTSAQLNSELTNDPVKMGYASYLTTTNDNATAALINSLTSVGAATVTIPVLTYGRFAELITPVAMAIGSATAAVQATWNPVLTLLTGSTEFQTTPGNMQFLNLLSSDFPNQLPASAVTAATTRIGSRAEVLWGAGTIINWMQIARAMGRIS